MWIVKFIIFLKNHVPQMQMNTLLFVFFNEIYGDDIG